MPYREVTVCWKRHAGGPLCLDPMIQNIILLQIGLAQEKKTYREATVLWNRHPGRPLCFDPVIHKLDSYLIPTVKQLINHDFYFGFHKESVSKTAGQPIWNHSSQSPVRETLYRILTDKQFREYMNILSGAG